MPASLRLVFVITLISFFQVVFASPAIGKPVGTTFSSDERVAGKNMSSQWQNAKERNSINSSEWDSKKSPAADTPWIFCPGYRACNRHGAMSHARNMAREIDNGVKRVKNAELSLPVAWQPNWKECYVEIRKSTVNVTSYLGDNHIRLNGLPPVCIALATTITHAVDGSVALIVCGPACIEHENMTGELFEKLRIMLNL
ncbi:hypothetical protein CH63R_13942 [Colletotrichum higginsianum IMI 349063]|uniref:Uncharacterized protein n=2 Tax=Colletotrichum higginsianum TaxID=80884 RepID=A0A1B7XSK0_COLHI|nr:hypothetical protein CH63R_13942 [Colletotrichum higginsianum IMI 349063]OBR02716.1 hypothetical protein CH63R_13942 [Colletotrichum higginsianum IMI 349063]TID06236.1 hypothetical protein CH35J_000425 [Colletotrichum higginsianum]GJD00675.1 hypothetical protein ColKHC_09500 [Colletotrichum higginsianum]